MTQGRERRFDISLAAGYPVSSVRPFRIELPMASNTVFIPATLRQPHHHLAAALQLLIDARSCASDATCSRWEFAVEIAALHAAGASLNAIRWLVARGLVVHGIET